jgi:hypothetical protein
VGIVNSNIILILLALYLFFVGLFNLKNGAVSSESWHDNFGFSRSANDSGTSAIVWIILMLIGLSLFWAAFFG